MPIVEITGWNVGFEKVRHTKALQEYGGLSLSEAKRATDKVLAGECIVLEMQALALAEELTRHLVALGAVVQIKN